VTWWVVLLIAWAAFLAGYLIRGWVAYRFSRSTGTIVVSKDEGRTMYSLILDDYPEKIELQKHVLFRVVEDDRE
jgi:hypothetical protein